MREWVNVDDFPRLHFFAEFVRDFILLTAFNVAARIFVWIWVWIDVVFPVKGQDGKPINFHSYVPVEHVAYALTAVHVVSILMISFSAIMTFVKFVQMRLSK